MVEVVYHYHKCIDVDTTSLLTLCFVKKNCSLYYSAKFISELIEYGGSVSAASCHVKVHARLLSQQTISGNYRPTSETPFKWRFAGGPIEAHFYLLTGYPQWLIVQFIDFHTNSEGINETVFWR